MGSCWGYRPTTRGVMRRFVGRQALRFLSSPTHHPAAGCLSCTVSIASPNTSPGARSSSLSGRPHGLALWGHRWHDGRISKRVLADAQTEALPHRKGGGICRTRARLPRPL